jgi:glycine/serine hydroxymethyltransferase
MVEEDMEAIAIAIDTVLNAPEDAAAITQARDIAQALCEKYPLPY